MNPRLFTFVGGSYGPWKIVRFETVVGAPLARPERLNIVNGSIARPPEGTAWVLRGVTSNERYVNKDEKAKLAATQAALGRPECTRAALIPIRKNTQWWALTQEERRQVFEESSHHIKAGLKHLPAVARRLHHCRDLEETGPFDFLTLFDYAEADTSAFEDLVEELRATEEWKYVDREIDVRLVREG